MKRNDTDIQSTLKFSIKQSIDLLKQSDEFKKSNILDTENQKSELDLTFKNLEL